MGALAGGFVLLPWLGSKWSLVVLAGLFIVGAFILLAAHPERRTFR